MVWTRMFFRRSGKIFIACHKTLAYPAGSRQFHWLRMDFVLRRMWSENIFWTLLTAVLIGAAILYGIVLMYALPLPGDGFENTTFGILIKAAFLVGGPVSVLHPADGGDLWNHGATS